MITFLDFCIYPHETSVTILNQVSTCSIKEVDKENMIGYALESVASSSTLISNVNIIYE